MKLEVISCPTSLMYLGGSKNLKLRSSSTRKRFLVYCLINRELTHSLLYHVIHKSSYEEYSSHQLDDERSQWCIHQRHREHHVIGLLRILHQLHPLLHLSYSQSFQINALPYMDFRICFFDMKVMVDCLNFKIHLSGFKRYGRSIRWIWIHYLLSKIVFTSKLPTCPFTGPCTGPVQPVRQRYLQQDRPIWSSFR